MVMDQRSCYCGKRVIIGILSAKCIQEVQTRFKQWTGSVEISITTKDPFRFQLVLALV